ncbi:MAG: tRNA (adenosine(37)-N6)-dimethylallyltransferase MiaA [Coriobacteriales bacterium]|nr:tRNA (adenosine(37)-N6)-dimethylallyltransferase MiaA [Coriobacteriales bacterium]
MVADFPRPNAQGLAALIAESISESGAPVVAIVGSTGVGKSAVADALALMIDGEIVSADSMQIYRGMDIGTAKVPEDSRPVPYHCIDIVDPDETFSAANFQHVAREAIDSILARGRKPIVCGGTGLYVRAALDVMNFPAGEQEDNPVRSRYTAIYEEHGAQYLHDMLAEIDPESAALIHPNNVRRTIRAFEMLDEGISYAKQNEGMRVFTPFYACDYFGLAMNRELLYERIDARVDEMMESGLMDECRALVESGFADALTSRQAIGNKELIDALRGRCTVDEAVELIKRSTRRYSKRQGTWFRRDPRIRWIDVLTGEFV